MTKQEFFSVITFISVSTDKSLSADRLEAYFELLGDLPFDSFRTAAKQVILEHPWASFPSVAELRSAATVINRGKSGAMTPAEIWEQALEASKKLDLDIQGPFRVRIDGEWQEFASQAAYVLRDVPQPVRRAMEVFGLRELVYATDPLGVVRGQFLRIAEQLTESSNRKELLPPSLRDAIAKVSEPLTNGKPALADFGGMPK